VWCRARVGRITPTAPEGKRARAFGVGEVAVRRGVAAVAVACACHVVAQAKLAPFAGEGTTAIEDRVIGLVASVACLTKVCSSREDKSWVNCRILNTCRTAGGVVKSAVRARGGVGKG